MPAIRTGLLAAALSVPAVVALTAAPASAQFMTPIGSYGAGVFDDSAAEIPAYDPVSQRLFVVNATVGVDVLDLSDPTMPTKVTTIAAPGANSVDVSNGVLAIAQAAAVETDPGGVLFYDAAGNFGDTLATATVGALPDMLTFTPDGTRLLVANEGEPGAVDPEGSVSIIDLNLAAGPTLTPIVSTVGFGSFTFANTPTTRTPGSDPGQSVRIDPAAASLAADVEPEYIAVAPDGTKAFVTLQEANTVAVVDLTSNTVASLLPLGLIDHTLPNQGLDASDLDAGVNIANWPVFGMFMPDAIASYEANGNTYFVTANEGDDRGEDERIANLTLEPGVFPANIQDDDQLGRLGVSTWDGDPDGDGDYDALYSYGTRSFTIFDEAGQIVFDSGDTLEQVTAATPGVVFNATNDENDSFESRSDNKGPEPEAIEIAELGGVTYAFVGLERVGGVAVFDITDPANSTFVDYVNPRDFGVSDTLLEAAVVAAAGTITSDLGSLDLGPEGLLFIDALDSPNGLPLLVVANEVSGTTTIYQVPEPALALPAVGAMALLRRKRR